ncbi:M3 family metallopeptidase [Streptomyces sp. NPDC006476]|uniref:M3 family metallopeptidase n=1 Tax=Streptomyces sp. NPDC006476 TaxID=3157175 RepID=UPI0033BCD5BF
MDAITGLDQASLLETQKILSSAKDRLEAILSKGTLTEPSFVELVAIYDNVAYVFLYLESNEQWVDYRPLLPYRDAFFRDDALDEKLLTMCRRLTCRDADLEECRRAYVEHLGAKRAADPASAQQLEQLREQAKELVQRGQADQLALLERLGARVDAGTADTIAYTLISTTPDAARRSKLSDAMTTLRDKRLGSLVETIDRMIAVRRETSRRKGFPTVLAETLQRCDIADEDARAMADSYLAAAIEEHVSLERDICGLIGDVGSPTDHFGHYVRRLQGEVSVPLFDLRACLDFLYQVAERVFGLTMRQIPDASPHVVTVVASRDDEPIGYINFDLWDSGRKRAANTTSGIRNRVDWENIVQLPIAYISCRFHRWPDGRDLITFQNVHSLFHEFGHAVNHILIRKRLPTLSGLDYLPLERIEDLSMWTEKWVYHPDFLDHLRLSAEERAGMRFCQKVKILEYRRTHVDRAVTSALDLAVHGSQAGGLREAFHGLDERFGISRYCSLGDFPVYFAWPMINANPGATFAYTRSAAVAASWFGPVLDRHLTDLNPADFDSTFTACFDFDVSSSKPDIRSIFAFYDDVLGRQPG